ncbi:cysteine proteinase, partial [Coniochaeta ligniaria NRRL 30616]
MFAKLESFECMLKNDLTEERTRKLAALIRLWVNMLRSGRLIHTDLTQHIQEALAGCGWQDAELLEQQDTSEAFAFITETLQLPLLTLQVDLFHHGKRDTDDHKVVYERLLNLAVPPDPEGKGLKLEDCLEEYFNTKVDVLRDSLEEKAPQPPRLDTAYTRLIAEENGEPATQVASPVQVEDGPLQTPLTSIETSEASPSPSRPLPRHRATSIIQRVVLDDQGRPTESAEADSGSLMQRAKRTGSTVVKAVTIPAWQFFRLIPWHATSNNEPRSDMEVARHFNKRPVVGICLKRYMMTNQGVPIRQNTFIDIPDSLRLPHFMMVDDMKVEQESLSAEYKLVLQSVVCHRGDSLHSGHYVSFARVAPKLLTDNRRHDTDPPPDYEEAQWLKFDDLCLEERVSCVDDIQVALREEMPYLLFYQIVPVVDVTSTSTDGSVVEPPAYDLSAVTSSENVPQTPSFDPVDPSEAISRSTSGYFDTLGSNGPSFRLSMEGEEGRPVRLSFDEDPYSSTSLLKPGNSRRGSVTFSEPYTGTPAVTPDSHSPAITPADEAAGTRLSRAAARFTKKEKERDSKSRPTSQAGEGRISLTMSRLGGLMRTSKEPLREDTAEDEDGVVIVGGGGAEEANGNGKEKEHRHHHHHHHRKDRGKSKSRGEKGGEKEAEAERECVV